jgi:hypothetical protein
MSISINESMKKDRSLNNLFIGMFATATLMLGVPYIFGFLYWKGAPTEQGWGILIAACFGMIVKLLASETASGEFEFYKFGYDNCVTTLGAVITALAIQLSSSTDLFPGLSQIPFPTFGNTDVKNARISQLISFFALTWLATFVTARICGGIKKKEVDERGFKSFLCALIGPFFLCLYTLLLAARG